MMHHSDYDMSYCTFESLCCVPYCSPAPQRIAAASPKRANPPVQRTDSGARDELTEMVGFCQINYMIFYAYLKYFINLECNYIKSSLNLVHDHRRTF